MRRWLSVILFGVAALPALGQTPSSKYQPGTIMAVSAHQSSGQANEVTRYDVSVKVGNTTYRAACGETAEIVLKLGRILSALATLAAMLSAMARCAQRDQVFR